MVCSWCKLLGVIIILKIASTVQSCSVSITPELSVYYAELGKSFSIAVYAYSKQHTWKKDGKPLAFQRCNDRDDLNCTKARIYTVRGFPSLRFRKITHEDRGKYTIELFCIIRHEFSYQLIVQVKPLVYIDCIDSTLYEGDNITCICKATNDNPPAIVRWTRTKPETGNSEMTNFTNPLTLRNISINQSGKYTCVAKSHTFVNKTSFNLKVVRKNSIPTNEKARIESFQAVQQLGDVNGHSKIFLICKAKGIPDPSYVISHNGTVVAFENIYTVDTGTISSLGQYACLAKNRLSSDKRLLLLNESFPVRTFLEKEILKTETQWEIGLIVGACSFFAGILTLYILMCCCKKFKKNNDRHVNTEYVDVSARNEGRLERASNDMEMTLHHTSGSPENEEIPYDFPVIENTRNPDYYNNSYQELSEDREKDEERYQSLNPINS